MDMRAEALRRMLDGDGWPLVRNFIDGRIKYHTDQLLTCKLEDVAKHRDMVEAYKSVFIFINEAIEESYSKYPP